MGVPDKVPDIEWWDAAIIKDGTYQGVVDDHPDPKVSAYAAPFSEYAVSSERASVVRGPFFFFGGGVVRGEFWAERLRSCIMLTPCYSVLSIYECHDKSMLANENHSLV
jgi:hypothetical protein